MSVGLPSRAAGPSGVINIIQAALGGGGYADGLSGPATGERMFVRGNYADLYRWQASTHACDNVTTIPSMTTLGLSAGSMGTPLATAIAPSDHNRCYLIMGLYPARMGYQAFRMDCGQLYASNDGGVTWHHVAGTVQTQLVAVGPAKPGSSYPTIYIFANLTGSPVFNYSVYRCTDWNPSTFTGTWVDVGQNLPKVECTSWRGGLCADPDDWSIFYMGSSDNGYVKGFPA